MKRLCAKYGKSLTSQQSILKHTFRIHKNICVLKKTLAATENSQPVEQPISLKDQEADRLRKLARGHLISSAQTKA